MTRNPSAELPGPSLLSIGHSNHRFEDLVELFRQHGVQVVGDVRTSPYSRHNPQFNTRNLKYGLKEAGIRYTFLGQELGGRPREDRYFDSAGRVLYGLVAKAPWFQSGLRRLREGAREYRVAILCSEENPAGCHRFLLITRALYQQGVDVLHIRGSGAIQNTEEIPAFEVWSGPVHEERNLFGEVKESSWRSTQSVSPRSRPKSSSRP